MSKPTVFIVDDDAAIRASLSLLLETHGLRVAAYEGAEALLAACSTDWQGCAVLDIQLKGMDGLALQAELQRRGVTLPVIFLTGHGDIPTTVRAMKAGACEFLTKPASAQQLLPLIRAALAQDRAARARGESDIAQRERLARLSQREWEVLQLVLAGHANKDIARILTISHRTVEVHRSHILSKTGVGSMLELAHKVSRDELQDTPAALDRPSV
jgi:FixJ family two-component response regulator